MLYRPLPGALCLLPVALFLTATVLATETAAPPFADGGDTPLVLGATRLQQSLFDVPAAVTVIDRQMIEQSGVREIPELLRLVPGMVVAYDSGSEAFVSFHGTSADLARRMQVLVDGRSIYQPLLASVDWTGLPLELADIERIEVIRGPNSAAWGANSFFAVVNIVSRHPADVERVRVSYARGEDGLEDFHARVAQRLGSVDWRLSVAGRSDEGFEQNLDRNRNPEYVDSKKVRSVYGRGAWAGEAGSSLELAFGAAAMEAQQQYRADIYLRPPVADRDNDFLSLAFEQEFGASNRLRLQASRSRFRREESWLVGMPPLFLHPAADAVYRQNRACINTAFDPATLFDTSACTAADAPLMTTLFQAVLGTPDDPATPADESAPGDPELMDVKPYLTDLDSREQRTEVELQDIWMIAPDLRAVFGATFDKAEATSMTYLGGSAENTVWRVFAHGEWRFAPDWLLNLGGNQEFDDAAGHYFSPRAALNWRVAAGQALRLVYSEAVRTPDIFENQADFRFHGTPADPADAMYAGTYYRTGQARGDAPTERIRSQELGYFARFDRLHLAVDLRGFRDDMKLSEHNLDVADSEGFEIRPVKKMWMTGGELGLDWRPLPSQRLQLNYAYLDLDGAERADDNTNFVPQHSGSLAWWQDYGSGWQFGNTYAFYNDLRVGSFFFDRLESRLAKRLALPGSQRLVLAAVLQTRLSNEAELRKENGADRYRGWFSADWHY
ncbi:MAG: TonB-dependent receptor plug domain-containing protein [Pseudomonadota bacterium]